MFAEPHTEQAEPTAPEPVPETNPTETPEEVPQAPAEPTETPEEKPAEERHSRSQERISQTIAARKAAEKAAETASAEAAYWKQKALESQQVPDGELPGVTEEGIDPVAYAKGLKDQILAEVRKSQGLTAVQQRLAAEGMEASAQPEMKDDLFREYAVNYAKANDVSPMEAFEITKEKFADLSRRKAESGANRDEAGKFVRSETSTPSAGRGSSSASTHFTRKQIDDMPLSEYEKNREEISRQLTAGLIK